MPSDNELCENCYLLEEKKKKKTHAHKTGSSSFFRLLSKILDKHPCPFYKEVLTTAPSPQSLRDKARIPRQSPYPKRARQLYLARPGSQSQREIRFILPARGASHIIKIVTSQRRKRKRKSHAHKTGSWSFFGFLSKILDKHPCPFYKEVFPPGPSPQSLHVFNGQEQSI